MSELQRNEPQDWNAFSRGWESQRNEWDYWVEASEVSGTIPEELSGTFFRNGPGIQEVFGTQLKHPIDGDGLVCSFEFDRGRVRVRSKYVETEQRLQEHLRRKFLYRGQMGTRVSTKFEDTTKLFRNLLFRRKLPSLQFRNPSNTNAFYWGGKLVSCYETQAPYELDPRTLQTLGKLSIPGLTQSKNLAAHFRVDPDSRNLVLASLKAKAGQDPKLTMVEVDQEWNLKSSTQFEISGLNYVHDFLLTPNYFIFHMTPFTDFSMRLGIQVMMGLTSPGESMRYYRNLPSRFVVVPRGHQSGEEIRYFETDPFHIFHFCHAREMDYGMKLSAVCLGEDFKMKFDRSVWLSNATEEPGLLSEFELNFSNSETSRRLLDDSSCEFPTTHPYRNGRDSRYTYLMANARRGENLPFRDIVKVDHQTGDRWIWKSEGSVGEPVFVPKLGFPLSIDQGSEDEGWVVCQYYLPETHQSEVVLLDAQKIDAGPVARIHLREHLPYSFHGTFWHHS